jgi:transposase
MRTVDIVKQLLIGRHSVSIWIKLYNQHGLDGLKNFSLGGRKEGDVKWSNEIFTALFEKLDSMDEFYSVPKMQSWIEDTYGVTIPQNTIHNRLRAGGYTFKSSRPNPYKGNPNLQASFKKTV